MLLIEYLPGINNSVWKICSLHNDWNAFKIVHKNVFDDTGSVIKISLIYQTAAATKIQDQVPQNITIQNSHGKTYRTYKK